MSEIFIANEVLAKEEKEKMSMECLLSQSLSLDQDFITSPIDWFVIEFTPSLPVQLVAKHRN